MPDIDITREITLRFNVQDLEFLTDLMNELTACRAETAALRAEVAELSRDFRLSRATAA